MSAYLNPLGADAPWKTLLEPVRSWSELSNMLRMIIRHPRFFFRISKTAIRDLIDMAIRPRRFDALVRPGDIVVSLGASWGFPGYATHIAAAKRRYGIRFATLIYDMIPIEHGSLVQNRHIVQFRKWFENIPNVNGYSSISKHSRHALLEFA
jgi:hypothetical protein